MVNVQEEMIVTLDNHSKIEDGMQPSDFYTLITNINNYFCRMGYQPNPEYSLTTMNDMFQHHGIPFRFDFLIDRSHIVSGIQDNAIPKFTVRRAILNESDKPKMIAILEGIIDKYSDNKDMDIASFAQFQDSFTKIYNIIYGSFRDFDEDEILTYYSTSEINQLMYHRKMSYHIIVSFDEHNQGIYNIHKVRW